MRTRLWHVPKISRKFVGEQNFVLLCYGRDESRTWYHPALVPLFFYFAASFHKAIGVHFSREKLCSVLSGEVATLAKGKHHMKFLVFTSRSKTSFFSFSQRFQCGPNSQNLIPSSHSCLTRQLRCFECAQQLPTLCLYCSVMHRQASRSQRWNSN